METDTHPVEAPTLESAHEALRRLYGPHTEDLWKTLLFSAGLTGTETDQGSFGRMVVSMQAASGVTGLCGRSLALRQAAFQRLAGGASAPGGTVLRATTYDSRFPAQNTSSTVGPEEDA